MRELALDHRRHAALLDHQENVILILVKKRCEDVHRAPRLIGRAKIEFVFVDGAARRPHLVGQRGQRVRVCQHRVQCTFFQQRLADAEKDFGREIRKNDAIAAIGHKQDMGKALHERLEIERLRTLGGLSFGLSPGGHRIEQTGCAH